MRQFLEEHKTLFQFLKFYLISLLVTVLQYLLLTFLPGFFYGATEWEQIPFQFGHIAVPGLVDTYVFNYPVADGGLAYFAAFAISLFIGQCVNFPIQRNLVFKSKGNIAYQIAWYIVAFCAITVVCSFLAGIYVPLLKKYFAEAVYNIAITVINGGVSMVIYFPVYKIIFPEGKPEEA